MARVFKSFDIGSRFCVLPPGTAVADGDRIAMFMAPGAFGSGEHETTRGCLEFLEQLKEVRGARVLDLGCGTGILAIAALKLGAHSAVCVDIDPDAVECCRLNCDLNRVSDRVEAFCGAIDGVVADGFDLVLANIYGDILKSAADDLVARTGAGALLLLSGISIEDSFDVRTLYEEKGCTVVKSRMLDEFTTVLLQKVKNDSRA